MPKKTFAQRYKRRKKNTFIGRTQHIATFRNNLIAEEDNYIPIFNIYGQGGVGKTYLSKHYRSIAQDNNSLTAYTDESIRTILDWMATVSEQFKQQKVELSQFNKRYTTYLQETKKLEADPEKPKGTLGRFVKTLTKGAVKEVKKLPGAEIAAAFIPDDLIANAAGEWAEFARKKMTNKDEVELVLDPIKVLTPLFWEEVLKCAHKFKSVCFCIDTFEVTHTFLEQWWLDVLNEKYGDVLPHNLLLVIAGREKLAGRHWSELSDMIYPISLAIFSEEEALALLTQQGITDPALQADLLRLSGRLPVLLDWLAYTAKTGTGNLTDACETAVERFLKWMDDPAQREIAKAMALPLRFNQDTLRVLGTDATLAPSLFDWLCKQPFVLKRGNYWAYHNVVREQMLRYLRQRSPQNWQKRHLALAHFYEALQKDLGIAKQNSEQFGHEQWSVYELERLYHCLCAKPDVYIKETVIAWVKQLPVSGYDASIVWGVMIKKAGVDVEHGHVKKWGEQIITAIQTLEEDQYKSMQQLVTGILEKEWIIGETYKADLYFINAYALSIQAKYKQAILFWQKAIAIKPDKDEAYNNMGNCYSALGEKEEAISSYQKAIAIKPDYHEAYNNMGNCYDDLGEKEQAISSYQKAIAIKPDYHAAYYNMGICYDDLGDKEKAINSYQKAIAIKPDDHKAYAALGFTFLKFGDLTKAEPILLKAIECGYIDTCYIKL